MTANSRLNCHHGSINNQEKTICLLYECQEQLEEKVDRLMRLVKHLRIKVNMHNESIIVLEEKVAEMEKHFCHCTDQGKGEGKEIIQVEEPLVFNYDSDNTYHTAPSTSGVKVLKLIPINSNPEDREVKKMEGYKSCGCGCASHPILLSSDNNVSVAENTIPIRIQVEHSPPNN